MQPSKIYEARGLRYSPSHRGQMFARKTYENNRALYNYWNIYERREEFTSSGGAIELVRCQTERVAIED